MNAKTRPVDSKQSHKSAEMRAVLHRETQQQLKDKVDTTTAFFVHEDGTFEKK